MELREKILDVLDDIKDKLKHIKYYLETLFEDISKSINYFRSRRKENITELNNMYSVIYFMKVQIEDAYKLAKQYYVLDEATEKMVEEFIKLTNIYLNRFKNYEEAFDIAEEIVKKIRGKDVKIEIAEVEDGYFTLKIDDDSKSILREAVKFERNIIRTKKDMEKRIFELGYKILEFGAIDF